MLKREADNLARSGNAEEALALYRRAYESYRQATDVSEGHSYPLLNEIKLAGRINGAIPTDIRMKLRLPKAKRFLEAQVADKPPSNAPWSFFDLSEVRLYSGDVEGFMNVLAERVFVGEPGAHLTTWDARLEPTRVRVGDVEFGGPETVVVAGPCVVEGLDVLLPDE